MLMPETVSVPAAGASIKQKVWLALLNLAISVSSGTWPNDQLAGLFQLLGGPAGAAQMLAVAGRQRSSRISSRGRNGARGFWKEKRCCFTVRNFLALDIETSCCGLTCELDKCRFTFRARQSIQTTNHTNDTNKK